MRLLAIVCAMQAELRALLGDLCDAQVQRRAGRDFHVGQIGGRPVVLALSGIGKVAAATTVALLLDRFEVDAVLFTGVAGGLHPVVRVGDVVVADALLQHDMDASPLFPRFEIPLTGRSRFACDAAMSDVLAVTAPTAWAAHRDIGAAFGFTSPRVHRGLIVSGDRFVSSAAESARLREALPDALAVEMEGAAAAQVCADFGVPCAVMRSISDRADDHAHIDFNRYIDDVASVLTRAVVYPALALL